MPLRSQLLVSTLVLLVCMGSPAFGGEDEAVQVKRWNSEAPNTFELSLEVLQLYEMLNREEQLPVRASSYPSEWSLGDILRRENLWFTDVIPRALDILLCKINSDVCTVREVETAHRTYPTQWRRKPTDAVMVPDLNFRIYTAPQIYLKNLGDDLSNIVVKSRRGCEAFDDRCRKLIENLNPRGVNVFAPDYAGRVVLPTIALTAEVKVDPTPPATEEFSEGFGLYPKQAGEAREAIDRALDSKIEFQFLVPRTNTDSEPEDRVEATPEEREMMRQDAVLATVKRVMSISSPRPSAASDCCEGSDSIHDFVEPAHAARESAISHSASSWAARDEDAQARLEAMLKASRRAHASQLEDEPANSATDERFDGIFERAVMMQADAIEPMHARQSNLFELISHPFADGKPIPGPSWMTVGVIDTWVDPYHCEFDDPKIHIGNPPSVDSPPPGHTDCTPPEIVDAKKTLDHGTHVVGIIGARENQKGMVGIDPEAGIRTFEAYQQDTETYVDEVARFLKSSHEYRIDIFNISATYSRARANFRSAKRSDNFESRLKTLQDGKLLVAAAGNGGIDMSSGCSVWPACFKIKNVVSVVALNSDLESPDVLAGSNYGTTFDIGAPGEGLLSATHGNKFGLMSGTSQAAPVVSGAASILWGTNQNFSPAMVRERLIVSSDLSLDLRDKIFGGRINLERALAWKSDFAVIDRGDVPTTIEGKLVHRNSIFWSNPEEFGDQGPPPQLGISRVLRLRRDHPGKSNSTYTMYSLNRSRRSHWTPDRHDGIVLQPTSKTPLQMVMPDGTVETFDPTEIVDFIARIKAQ